MIQNNLSVVSLRLVLNPHYGGVYATLALRTPHYDTRVA